MPITNILVPTDFSPGSQEALRYAFDLAVKLGATIHILHVLENPFAPGAFMEMYSPPPDDYVAGIERQAEETMRGLLTPDQQKQCPTVMTMRRGIPTAEILERLQEAPTIDLVVMATHGRGSVTRLLMGSVTDRIVRSAPCPVLTMREHPRPVRPGRGEPGAKA